MRFLINPAKRGSKRRRVRRNGKGQFVARQGTRRRVRRAKRTQSGGVTMASRRRRRRRATARRAAPRRRRRRAAVVVYRANPPRRRRRRHHVARRRHARRYRRNPGLGGGLVSTIKSGIGLALPVIGGEVAQSRVAALAERFIPVGGAPGTVIKELGAAVVTTMAARRFVPGKASYVAAGAFANATRRIVTAFAPSIGGMLSAYPDGLSAYPMLGDGEVLPGIPNVEDYASIGAYPQLGDAGDAQSQYAYS